jgi:hypothetical protein
VQSNPIIQPDKVLPARLSDALQTVVGSVAWAELSPRVVVDVDADWCDARHNPIRVDLVGSHIARLKLCAPGEQVDPTDLAVDGVVSGRVSDMMLIIGLIFCGDFVGATTLLTVEMDEGDAAIAMSMIGDQRPPRYDVDRDAWFAWSQSAVGRLTMMNL